MKLFLIALLFFQCINIRSQNMWHRTYDYIDTDINKNGLRIVGLKDNEHMKYGCIDINGKEIVALQWDYIYRSNYNLIPVIKDGHIGYINTEGKTTIPTQYIPFKDRFVQTYEKECGKFYPPYRFLNGLTIIKNSTKPFNGYGVIDINNQIIVPFEYDFIWSFNGWSMWALKGNNVYLIFKDGRILKEVKYTKKLMINEIDIKSMLYISRNTDRITKVIKYNTKKLNNDEIDIESIYSTSLYSDELKSIWWQSNDHYIYVDDLGNEQSEENDVIAANELIRKNQKGIDTDINRNRLATLYWKNCDDITSNHDYELKVDIKSSTKIENISISINGIHDRGINTIEKGSHDITINKIIALSEGNNVIKISVTNAAGTTQEEKTIVYRPQGGELPSIEWLDFVATANKKEYQMRLGIKSKTKVEEVNVTVNGALTRGIKSVPTDGYDLKVDRTLALSEGVNRIVVSVRNGDGIATSEKVITCQGINPTPIFNDKRIAFVVGNSHYSNSEMNLANPENDAKDVAEKLKGLGFEVVLKLDATKENMEKELSAFGEKAKDYDVAMFYYAGHGIQSKGVNYLIPTNIEDLAENNLKWKCVNVEQVLDVMEDSQCKLKIVVLDACRNDPVSRKWHRSAGNRGLSIMDAPTGTIISFSTSPGSTALDGTGRNSPYTQAFLNTLDMPNLDVFHFFQKVGASVLDLTQKAQNPWLSVSFTGDFYFNKQ